MLFLCDFSCSYDEIYDETLRLNKKHFEGNPAAGGVAERGPDRDSASPAQKVRVVV